MQSSEDPKIGSGHIGANLQRLRLIRGLSQAELSEKAEISRVALRAIETAESVPRVDTLSRLANVLAVGVDDLLKPVTERRGIRFRSDKRMTTRREIIARVSHALDLYEELEKISGTAAADPLPALRRLVGVEESPTIDAQDLAARARAALKLGPKEPLVDVCAALERAEIKVLTVPVAAEGFFGLSVSGGSGAIVVNTWERISVERWIFSAAHELGHLLADTSDYDVGATEEEEAVERRADAFAGFFLMPQAAFTEAWAESQGLSLVDRVLKVKRAFRVSYKTVLYRVASRHPEGGTVWPAFYREFKRRFGHSLEKADEPRALARDAFREAPAVRRADEPEQLSAHDFVEARLPWLVRTAVDKGQLTQRRAAEMLGLTAAEFKTLKESWSE